MADSGKRIIVSVHAAQRMQQRGADWSEVEQTIREATWQSAARGKRSAARVFPFNAPSPINNKQYTYKKIEVVFADEPTAIVVVTVKVYYHNEAERSL